MLFRRSISVLILVVLGVAVGVWASFLPAGWQTSGTVPQDTFVDPPDLPVPGQVTPTAQYVQQATEVGYIQTDQTASDSVPQLPGPIGVPQAQSGGAAAQRAFKSGSIPQPTTYPIGDLDGHSLVGAMTEAVPDAGFMFFEKDNKKVYVVGTPAEHERVRQVIKTLANLKEPPVGSPATWPKGPVSASGGGRRLGTPSTVLQRTFGAPPAGGSGLDATEESTPKDYSTGTLKPQAVAEILKVMLGQDAIISVTDDGKKLNVAVQSAEHEKVKSVLDSLQRAAAPTMAGPGSPNSGPYSAGAFHPTRSPYGTSPARSNRAWNVTPPAQAATAATYPRTTGYPANASYSYASSLQKSAPPDPEIAKLEEADATMGKKVAEIVKEFRAAVGDEQQAKVRFKLKTAVDEHFAVRQEKQALELSRLEAQLETIRQSIAKRDKAREQIVDRHISKLLGEADDLAF